MGGSKTAEQHEDILTSLWKNRKMKEGPGTQGLESQGFQWGSFCEMVRKADNHANMASHTISQHRGCQMEQRKLPW